MKQLHILNIGFPKCGTTWLWNTLVKNNSILTHPIKENRSLQTGTPVSEYYKQYNGNITANFDTSAFKLDRYVIKQLSDNPAVRVSIILREPVELLWSLYSFLKIDTVDFATYCYQMHDTKWFTHTSLIIDRWKTLFGDRFHIFWYQDLVNDNLKFYLDYCKIMELDPGKAVMPGRINVTDYEKSIPAIDKDLKVLLQNEFEKISIYK